eukprot:scaffold165759_cov23-Tisochrysis_lutea.AAC.1
MSCSKRAAGRRGVEAQGIEGGVRRWQLISRQILCLVRALGTAQGPASSKMASPLKERSSALLKRVRPL